MQKILILPFLQMRSGHHLVAEALSDQINQTMTVEVKKVELLSAIHPRIEKLTSSFYLCWIHYVPSSYSFIYRTFFAGKPVKEKRHVNWYQAYFLKKMQQIITREQPDLIICTHGFPSYLVNELKKNHVIEIPVINVYTDFFVNRVWGRTAIDYHFLPSQEAKIMLHASDHVLNRRLLVTGIPVHAEIVKMNYVARDVIRLKVLIAGGNNGLGQLRTLLRNLRQSAQVEFYVLCGNNRKLYDEIASWQSRHITPLPYIASRNAMNDLYDAVDAIVTKPGGVTISEALRKKLPVFVSSVLPGQEEINLTYLLRKKLVFNTSCESLEVQLLRTLRDDDKMKIWQEAIVQYENELISDGQDTRMMVIEHLLENPNWGGRDA